MVAPSAPKQKEAPRPVVPSTSYVAMYARNAARNEEDTSDRVSDASHDISAAGGNSHSQEEASFPVTGPLIVPVAKRRRRLLRCVCLNNPCMAVGSIAGARHERLPSPTNMEKIRNHFALVALVAARAARVTRALVLHVAAD